MMAIFFCKKTTLPFIFQYNIKYKNIILLRRYIGIKRQIIPRIVTNLTAKENRCMSKAIRQARSKGFLPYVLPIPL